MNIRKARQKRRARRLARDSEDRLPYRSDRARKPLAAVAELALLALLMPLTAHPQSAASCDFSGIWFDPLLAGEGYNVYADASGLVVYFLGFDNWGDNFWVTSDVVNADGLEFGETVFMPMLIAPMAAGSEFAQPLPPSTLAPWGQLVVSFDSCVSGVFILDAYDRWNFGYKVSNVVKLMGPDS